MLTPRGKSPFDAQALRRALHEDGVAPDEMVQAYLGFYGLGGPEFAAAEHALEIVDLQQQKIVVQTWMPPDPCGVVLFCHGYYDHIGLFGYVFEYLLKKNLGILTFDQVGHGLSSGAPATIDSFDTYVSVLGQVLTNQIAQLPRVASGEIPLHFFGQSMGGALVMEYLHGNPGGLPVASIQTDSTDSSTGVSPGDEAGQIKLGEVVLFAPLVRPFAWHLNRIVFMAVRHLIESRPRTITNNAENPEFLELQHADPLQADILPVQWVQAMVDWFTRFETYPPEHVAPLIIQGRADRTVSWRWNHRLLSERYPDGQWLWLDTGGHHLANESSKLRGEMWSWLDERGQWGSV